MLEPKITEVVVESDAGRWGRLIKKFPQNAGYNTIALGTSKITFTGEPQEELRSYLYDKGKNRGERSHVVVSAFLHLSQDTSGKVVGVEYSLGLSRCAFQSLFAYLQVNALPFRLSGRTFTCTNAKNRRYSWEEIKQDGGGPGKDRAA